MSYVQRVLQPDETLVYATTRHWFVYLKAIFLALLTLALLIGSWLLPSDSGAVTVLLILAAIGGVLTLWFWLVGFADRTGTEFAVTNRRVIYKEGLIRRRTVEMNLSAVESVDVEQSILGRLLDFGHVQVVGTGGSPTPYPMISDPLTFRSHITARRV